MKFLKYMMIFILFLLSIRCNKDKPPDYSKYPFDIVGEWQRVSYDPTIDIRPEKIIFYLNKKYSFYYIPEWDSTGVWHLERDSFFYNIFQDNLILQVDSAGKLESYCKYPLFPTELN